MSQLSNSSTGSIYLGIDPGIATTGYAFLAGDRDAPVLIDFGVITTAPDLDLPERLSILHQDLQSLIQQYCPGYAFVEEVYFGSNVTSAIAVLQARGVVMRLLFDQGLDIASFHPSSIKQQVTGHGQADKLQMMTMVQRIFALQTLPTPDDAADAIAIAYTGLLLQSGTGAVG